MNNVLTEKSSRLRPSAWLLALLMVLIASWVLGPTLSSNFMQSGGSSFGEGAQIGAAHQAPTGQAGAAAGTRWPDAGSADSRKPLTLRTLWAQRDGADVPHLSASSTVVLASTLALGLIALLLTLTQRSSGDAALAGACLLWAAHTALGEPAFGAAQRGMLQAVLLGFCGLTGWYALRVLDLPMQSRSAVLPAFGLTSVALLIWVLGAVGAMDNTVGQALVLLLVVAMGLMLLVQVIDAAHREDLSQRARLGAWAVSLALAAALACMVHELGRLFGVAALLNAALPGAGSAEATRWAVLTLLAVLTGVRVDQVARTVRRLEEAHRVSRKRERETSHTLQATLDELYARDRTEAQRQQRDRLLRELHDEIGQRVTRALELTHPTPGAVAAHESVTGGIGGRGSLARTMQLQGLLDSTLLDLRLALSALDRGNPLLCDAMSDLRKHIEPLLLARGVGLQWQMSSDTGRLRLGAAETLQLLRIAQESLVNLLHYCESANQATLVLDVSDSPAGRQLRLAVHDGVASNHAGTDDITPLPSPTRLAPGWGNLQRQASALGAQLEVGRQVDGWAMELRLALRTA